MSYCYYVKPIDDIPQALLEKYDIQTDPVIFRGNQINVPLMSSEDDIKHKKIVDLGIYPLYKSKFNDNNYLARDHNH
ncbi:Uncharacterized protein FWK35_00032860 [Aphis craccivora]|uniref:Uncharacterized protein n=1 Tax=Aphis craccivora TaxID=307492 RepID=A0A6G0VNB8_APHCR|nr:Uncharacterized protein FWK35_00032860 [Aphis craccivora]